MRNHIIAIIGWSLICSFHFSSQAQSSAKGIIQGVVVDEETRLPLAYTTISLYSMADSVLRTGGITEDDGRFKVEVDPGSYYADLSFLSFQTRRIGSIVINSQSMAVDLGTLELTSDATVLAEVEVRAERSRMEISLDKRVFNVGKDLANTGGSAIDVLDNVPSVSVDVEGNVSLRGMSGLRILIDGKPSGLIASDNTNGLRSIPSNLIDRIEVITNPSARYEAEGMAGIINIVLKKEKKEGLNGSFDLSGGYPATYGGAANLNLRKKNLNFFATYGFRYRENPRKSTRYQEFYKNDTTFLSSQLRDRVHTGYGHTLRSGFDYYFNEKTILTAALTYRKGIYENSTELTYRDYLFSLDQPNGISQRFDDEKETEPNLEYSVSFRKDYKKKDHTLTIDFRVQDNDETEESAIEELFFDNDFGPTSEPPLIQRSENNEREQRYIGQLDYVYPFTEEGQFEFGLRSGIRRIDNHYLVEELGDGVWETLDGISNDFNYDEDIHAAYTSYGNKVGKFSYQAGLRAEYSIVKTELLQTNEVNERDYLNLFPSAFLNYELSEGNSIQLSYSRRIRRPRFRSLNPFSNFTDSRNYRSGNPNLDPEFTHSLELGHIKYWDQTTLTSSIYYRYTDNVIERIHTVDENGYSVSRPENLATRQSYGLEFTFSTSPLEWWDIDGNVNLYRSAVDGGNIEQSLESKTFGSSGRLTSKFKPWKSVDGQIRFNYRGPRNDTQGKVKAHQYMDLAVSKDILQNNGTLTFSLRDVFNSRKYRYTSEGLNFYDEVNYRRATRSFVVSLNYRLNQSKKKQREGNGGEDFDGNGDF